MKRIILSCAVAFGAIAFCMNSNAGAAPKMGAYKYAVNDTIPKKDTVKKDTTHTLHLQVK